jgi:ABC-type transporter Mla subunit MlaD
MHSASSAAALLAAALVLGCGRAPASERRELERLEGALDSLSASLEGAWLDHLDDVKGLEIESPRVAAVRATCVAAYEAFGEATARLAAAKKDVARLEERLRAGTDGGLDEIAHLHRRASQAAADVSGFLDSAEALVARCGQERRSLREALAASR